MNIALPLFPGTYHGEVLKWTSRLDVLQSLLQILQLSINFALGLLGALDGLRLECLNGLHLSLHVILLGLEGGELLLEVVDDVLVLQEAAVLGKVDSLWLVGEDLDLATGNIVALLECGKGLRSAASEAELGAQIGPVDLRGGRTLSSLC